MMEISRYSIETNNKLTYISIGHFIRESWSHPVIQPSTPGVLTLTARSSDGTVRQVTPLSPFVGCRLNKKDKSRGGKGEEGVVRLSLSQVPSQLH